MGCGTSKSTVAEEPVTENKKSTADNTKNGMTINNNSQPAPQEGTAPRKSVPDNKGVVSFELEALAAHNKYRQIHDAPPLELDHQMCQEAQAYAEKLAQEKQMRHSSHDQRNGQGENLAFSGGTSGSRMTGQYASEMWYSEVKDYDFQKSAFAMGTGHFTQVVWKGSTKFGIGSADYEKDGMQCTMVVGRYYSAGNVLGKFDDNVVRGSYTGDVQ